MRIPKLAIIVPCYNEQETLEFSAKKLKELLSRLITAGKIKNDSQICFVNDGSRDSTWEIIQRLCSEEPLWAGICLSRNFGHQKALLAGLFTINADAYVTIDADLQDDPNAIEEMCDRYSSGAEIVLGVRSKRAKDTFFKRFTAHFFYQMMRWLGTETVKDHADFRLMSSLAVKTLAEFPERNVFLRGMIPMLGFRTEIVYYERDERIFGTSKYPLKKMLAFAWEGITSLSIVPLRLISALGIMISLLSLILIIYTLLRHWTGQTIPGWSSQFLASSLLAGIQMFSLAIVGEYIGKIYQEVKRRPQFLVSQTLNLDNTLPKKPVPEE